MLCLVDWGREMRKGEEEEGERGKRGRERKNLKNAPCFFFY